MPVPAAIEEVGGGHDEEVLRFQVAMEDEPVEQEHDREKYGEFQ